MAFLKNKHDHEDFFDQIRLQKLGPTATWKIQDNIMIMESLHLEIFKFSALNRAVNADFPVQALPRSR